MADESLSPKQVAFLTNYLDPESETFSNALKSALKAGYAQEYAENITHLMPEWLSDRLGDEYKVSLAEKNLETALEPGFEDKKIWWDASKFTLSRLKKEKYSERTEHTGKDGKDLPTPILNVVSSDNGSKENQSTQ